MYRELQSSVDNYLYLFTANLMLVWFATGKNDNHRANLEKKRKYKLKNLSRLIFLGGNVSFSKYEDLQAAFAKQEIHPGDLKNAAEIYINRLLDSIRKEFETVPKLKSLANKAYPPPQKQSNL